MSNIKVSIIIPVYNMEKYLNMCLDTVVNQTLSDTEIILINDGSTDASWSIIQSYKEKYPDKIIAHTKENAGQGCARNIGIHMSHGEYIGFVDADDYIELDMYQEMYEVAEKNDCDYVECDYKFLKVVDGKEVELKPYGDVRARKNRQELFINPLVSPWNKLYKGELLRNNDISFPEGVIYEDTSFYLKAIPHINKMMYIDKPYVKHFLRANSTMTGSKSKRVADIFQVLEDAIKYYKTNDYYKDYNMELDYFCTKILLCSSMERIANIGERELRKEYIRETWIFISNYLDGYKSNKYLNGGLKNLYMKVSNKFVSQCFVWCLRWKKRLVRE